ncbi:hypothetical protein M9H77_16790 [Catharanthus roseus]|uniref:Uncharacterized protein n=1 Tax=Catharanthus roseus TaxID=4058 RepID=A0ACC0B2Y2_CATRO|nr:hypothetical protein M9H77_16790 [Catharanthus roseus]
MFAQVHCLQPGAFGAAKFAGIVIGADLRLVAVVETAEHHQVAVAEVDGEADLAHLLAVVQQDISNNLHRGRSADAWVNIATTDQRGGTPIIAGVETFSRARNSSNNISNLSSEQWSKLLTFINNKDVTQFDKLSSMKNLWILDSGCSHHMTGRKYFLSNLNNVYPYTIGQPNGTKSIALQEGMISP